MRPRVSYICQYISAKRDTRDSRFISFLSPFFAPPFDFLRVTFLLSPDHRSSQREVSSIFFFLRYFDKFPIQDFIRITKTHILALERDFFLNIFFNLFSALLFNLACRGGKASFRLARIAINLGANFQRSNHQEKRDAFVVISSIVCFFRSEVYSAKRFSKKEKKL